MQDFVAEEVLWGPLVRTSTARRGWTVWLLHTEEGKGNPERENILIFDTTSPPS